MGDRDSNEERQINRHQSDGKEDNDEEDASSSLSGGSLPQHDSTE